MSLQDLLTKDYRKNPLPATMRFLIIIGNLCVFLFFSGWHQDGLFGPKISSRDLSSESVCQAINSFSTLDMTAIILAILLVVKQLSFKRPDIDSFKEIMTFPACEKKWAVLLLIFSIFKFFYQFPSETSKGACQPDNPLAYWLKLDKELRVASQGELKSKDLASEGYSNEEWKSILSNLLLILSSSICVGSSFHFRYKIKKAERELQVFLLQYSEFFLILAIIFEITILLFVADTKYLGIILFVALLFDVIRISRFRYNTNQYSNQTFDVSDYTVSLKWISISAFGIVLYSSYCAYLLELWKFKKTDKYFRVSSYFMLYYRNESYSSGTVGFLSSDHCGCVCGSNSVLFLIRFLL